MVIRCRPRTNGFCFVWWVFFWCFQIIGFCVAVQGGQQQQRRQQQHRQQQQQQALWERSMPVKGSIQSTIQRFLGRQKNRGLDNYYNDDYVDDNNQAAAYDDDDLYNNQDQSSIDLTSYSLKYVGCQNVHTWSDYNVYSNLDSPLKLFQFVILRLCPSDTCNPYNSYGCHYHYGEYLLPLDDYLQIVSSTHVAQINEYCSVCEACLNYEPPTQSPTAAPTMSSTTAAPTVSADDFYAAVDDDDNDFYYANSNYYNYGNRKLDNYGYGNYNYDDVVVNDDGYYTDDYSNLQTPYYIQNNVCIFESVCENYVNHCAQYDTTSQPDYFTCTQTDTGSYVGPHCGTNGHTIELGLFADNTCDTYLKSMSSGNYQLYYAKDCLECNYKESFGLIDDNAYDYDATNNPMCSALFESSAQCHENVKDGSALAYDNADGNAAQNDNNVCTFVESLLENNYDETGEVYIQEDFEYQNWKRGSEYTKLFRKASVGQLLGLFVSMGTCFGLLGYAVYLHKKLLFRKPWIPPKSVFPSSPDPDDDAASVAISEAGRLSRRSSGIVNNRSSYEAPYIPYGAPIPRNNNRYHDHQSVTSGLTSVEYDYCDDRSTQGGLGGDLPPHFEETASSEQTLKTRGGTYDDDEAPQRRIV